MNAWAWEGGVARSGAWSGGCGCGGACGGTQGSGIVLVSPEMAPWRPPDPCTTPDLWAKARAVCQTHCTNNGLCVNECRVSNVNGRCKIEGSCKSCSANVVGVEDDERIVGGASPEFGG